MQAFSFTTRTGFLFAAATSALVAITGCGSDTSGTGGGGGGGATPGGPVSGAQDNHCTTTVTVDPNMCMGTGGAGGMGGTGGAGGHVHEEMHDTLYNAEGDDDDCKYHVKWSSSDVFQNKDVTFTIELTAKADNSPVTGADPDIEAFLSDTHPAPNSSQKPTEVSAGKYEVGPVQFDAAGQWTVRFHFFEDCMDMETSPHGHVGFYLNVP